MTALDTRLETFEIYWFPLGDINLHNQQWPQSPLWFGVPGSCHRLPRRM